MHKKMFLLLTFLISYTNLVQTNCDNYSLDSDIPQTRAQVHTLTTDTLNSATVDTGNLFCDEAEIATLTSQNAVIQSLTVEHLSVNTENRSKRINYVERTFYMRDIFRVGSTGFKAIRTIKNISNFPLSPNNEIRGWKMTESTDQSKDNDALYVTDYTPNIINSKENNILIDAHFILPKLDAPEDGIEEFVKVGVWIDCIQDQSVVEKPAPDCFKSDNILIPTKNSFGSSKIIHFTTRVTIPNHMVKDGLFYVLLKRIAVSDDKVEFDNKQGIALNSLTIQYPA